MRVLFWTEFFLPYIGGIEVMTAQLMLGLRERGYDFTLITSCGNRDLPAVDEYEGIPLYRFPFQEALMERKLDVLLRVQRQVNALVREITPDLIHLHLGGISPFFILKTAELSDVPLIVTLHGMFPQELMGPLTIMSRIFKRAAWFTAVSHSVLDQVLVPVPEIAERASIIYYGWRSPSLTPTPLPFDPPRLLCVGRIVREKGFHLVLPALAELLPRYPDVQLVIAGDGPARAELQELAVALGLRHNVDFTGWVPPEKVFDLMNSVTLVIMPSHSEGLPNVAIQAALMGRPVIGSRVTGLDEVVVDHETGLLVQKDSSEALTEAIAYLLENPQVAVQMGRAARQRAPNLFSWDHYLDAYDELYRKFGSRPSV